MDMDWSDHASDGLSHISSLTLKLSSLFKFDEHAHELKGSHHYFYMCKVSISDVIMMFGVKKT